MFLWYCFMMAASFRKELSSLLSILCINTFAFWKKKKSKCIKVKQWNGQKVKGKTIQFTILNKFYSFFFFFTLINSSLSKAKSTLSNDI